jgi:hypothetical protein
MIFLLLMALVFLVWPSVLVVEFWVVSVLVVVLCLL